MYMERHTGNLPIFGGVPVLHHDFAVRQTVTGRPARSSSWLDSCARVLCYTYLPLIDHGTKS